MRRLFLWYSVSLSIGLAIALAGCGNRSAPTRAPSTPLPTAAASTGGDTGPAASTPPDSGFTVRYGWGLPIGEAVVEHPLTAPLPGRIGVPLLVEVRTGDHPAEGFARVTFAFRGAYPGYRIQYVPQIIQDGSGEAIAVPGDARLRVVFTPAQAHDEAGNPTTPGGVHRANVRRLIGYARAGDYESTVTYGLGVAASAADGAANPPEIRVAESIRPDGTFIVSIDVR